MRFQVLINGQPACIAGIDGPGVLGAVVDRVQRGTEGEKLSLRVSGLGRYDPDVERDCYADWLHRNDLKAGDEITIRILPEGQYDPPACVRLSSSAETPDSE